MRHTSGVLTSFTSLAKASRNDSGDRRADSGGAGESRLKLVRRRSWYVVRSNLEFQIELDTLGIVGLPRERS